MANRGVWAGGWPDKQDHQQAQHHTITTELGFSWRTDIKLLEYIFKHYQVQELHQSQQTSESCHPLGTNIVRGVRPNPGRTGW